LEAEEQGDIYEDDSKSIFLSPHKAATRRTTNDQQQQSVDPVNEFVDISMDEYNPSHMPSVERSIETLSQI